MPHNAQFNPTALTIDDMEVAFGRPVELFQQILGPWSRIFTGILPAPAGHRNNIRYIYDDLGISLDLADRRGADKAKQAVASLSVSLKNGRS